MKGDRQWLSKGKAKGACAKRVADLLSRSPEPCPPEGVQPLNAGFFKLERFKTHSLTKGK